MARYSVLLLPDVKRGGYTVEVPSLPEVITEGDTREEAIANARDAIGLLLEDLAADGEVVPTELARPELVEIDVPVPQVNVPVTA